MLKLIYQILFISLFCFSINDLIKIDNKNFKNEILTKNGLIKFEREVDSNFDLKYNSDRNTRYHLSDLKNLKKLNLKKIREKYKKYDINVFSYQLNILRIISHIRRNELRNLLITEILYDTGYINKKIYFIDNNNYLYFGGAKKNFKYYKKFIFNKNDIISDIKVKSQTIDIKNKKYNFFDFISNTDFIRELEDILKKFSKADPSIYKINKYNSFVISNLKVKIGNKIIKINKYNYKKDYYGEFSNKDYSLIFFENFLSNFDYREYNLETGEITFYLQNYNDIIQEKEEIILNGTNLDIIIFFIVIFCIVFTVFINYNKIIKNKYFEYFNNLNNDILL